MFFKLVGTLRMLISGGLHLHCFEVDPGPRKLEKALQNSIDFY